MLRMDGDATTAGDILNYPYSYDQDRAQEVVFQEQLYRASAGKSRTSTSLHPGISMETFTSAKELGQSLCDMCNLEGTLERKRRDLALR